MFEGIRDGITLTVHVIRMYDIQIKLSKGERLTPADEEYLKLNLLERDPRREFKDEKHRDRLLAQWRKEAKVLSKKLKEEEKKEAKKK